MKINKLLTPYNHNPGTTDRIKYIVIHYVGALGGAKANCQYYAGGSRGASAHYFVDFDGSIWQSVEDRDIAWHCGAKTYRHPECRNANSIGIELCVRNSGSKADTSRDWYFEDATVASAIQLTRKLMAKYGVPADHVIRLIPGMSLRRRSAQIRKKRKRNPAGSRKTVVGDITWEIPANR